METIKRLKSGLAEVRKYQTTALRALEDFAGHPPFSWLALWYFTVLLCAYGVYLCAPVDGFVNAKLKLHRLTRPLRPPPVW